MGLLDHSTNNIILDAVLTDHGRQKLAMGGTAFNITYFALADDEVDYRVVKKYGRAVGKEKIEKNTPIFEAMTNPSVSLKYRLIGRENNGTTISTAYLPVLSTSTTVALQKGKTVNVKVQLSFNNATGLANIPSELLQKSYSIKVPDRFFSITKPGQGTLTSPTSAATTVDAGDPNRVATYVYTTSQATDFITFDVVPQNIDNTALTVYGKNTGVANQKVINSYITVIGEQHGSTLQIPVTYTATLTL
jgi:hypothetical protein